MQAFSFAFVCDHFLTQNRIHYILVVALVDVRFQSQPTPLFLSCHHWCNSLLFSFLMFAQPPLRPLPDSAALALRLLPPLPLGSVASERLPQHPRRLVLLLPPQRALLLCNVCMYDTDEKVYILHRNLAHMKKLLLIFKRFVDQAFWITGPGTGWRRAIRRRGQRNQCVWCDSPGPGVWCDGYHRLRCSDPGHSLRCSGSCPGRRGLVRWRNHWWCFRRGSCSGSNRLRRLWRSSCPGS